MHTLILFFLLLNIPLLVVSLIHPRCFWRMKQNEEKNGNLKTGCIFAFGVVKWPVEKEYYYNILSTQTNTENHQFSLALAFSMDEINKNPDLLPNKSLLFDFPFYSCKSHSELTTLIHGSVQQYDIFPNYVCNNETMCTLLLTGPNWKISVILRTYLDLYKSQQFLQLTYGPFHPVLSDNEQFPYLYQMAPKETSLALALVSFLIHFSWNWIGLAISDNDQGNQFLSYLRTEMGKYTVCFAFVNMIPVNMQLFMTRTDVYYNQIITSSTNVVIVYGDTDSTLALGFKMWKSLGVQRIWVTTSEWDVITSKRDFTFDTFHSIIAFQHHHGEISGFKNFVQTLNPFKYSDKYLVKLEWMYFNCEISASNCKTLKNCLYNESFEWLSEQTFDMAFSDGTHDIYNAAYAVAHALHEFFLQQGDNQQKYRGKWPNSVCLKLHSLLKKTHFTNPVGDRVIMNQREKMQEEYDIFYIWNFPQGLGLKVKIGEFSPYYSSGKQLWLFEDMIEWTTGNRQMPSSVCNSDCGPGFRKIWKEGMSTCCFDCIHCQENEISNETNVDQCVKCPEDQYANPEQNHCIHKALIFLTYQETLGMTLSLVALCLSTLTAAILGVFVKYHTTPIVKANNCRLTYILLITLIFCFLCPLLYIGHPNSVTCVLQQVTFGIVFTVAISTVLAKTITVILAFKVTAPQRMIKYFLISGVFNYIIPICTLIQVFVCTLWLGTSPPSVDFDPQSEHGHIIIVCNKGSVTAFYCMLGYLSCLALGSFTLAFLSRNLPGTFNEAKFLTFSMLVFCSVWITFLPVYHSTKGKVMVAVEIFSTLASSAGMLGCIFIPKCYIILLRPERNSLQRIREK
ncbi:vomeronasal 2 receptor, 16 precursor [Rattus norvegicus]|uniref:Vomeronasal 2 receptor, 16 n=1 Tax=Rattus norvegicus TaxID=10116 RepID=A0A0G2JYA5_RAT|nr:vomeronasal 2 receptor, 16 precursor [Rattus norvegicus]|eukprot:NP_001093125.1 vomeronasal 2 receptor, 16 precursor [Rattus norvegicus]